MSRNPPWPPEEPWFYHRPFTRCAGCNGAFWAFVFLAAVYGVIFLTAWFLA